MPVQNYINAIQPWKHCTTAITQRQLFYGLCTGEPVLASTSS